MAETETYTLEEEEYSAADIAKMDDEEYDHLLARANTLNEAPADIQWLMDSREKATAKKSSKATAEE